jgi:hypothetical protein
VFRIRDILVRIRMRIWILGQAVVLRRLSLIKRLWWGPRLILGVQDDLSNTSLKFYTATAVIFHLGVAFGYNTLVCPIVSIRETRKRTSNDILLSSRYSELNERYLVSVVFCE